jgi:hypothetical protein
MTLTEESINDKIEIVDNGSWKSINIRKATIIKRNGIEVSRSFERRFINPTDDISNEDVDISGIATQIFTEEIKENYKKLTT